ncbi:DcaP family trimeric outer membrane transporter [Flavobacterium branchiarum]|uniref:DcaP family trimeric outer membrane transporter n=1 Tax=Flavobacterium branchiarum TaxID=1114870 RepID=A0ABV5FQ99_9FLAO|nr:DcaP family trimeric outer membrane transporter [Flavobacterium branchiarum]MDN3673240.1 DcaP family trimeric outer membrane transporter [Flavobacterium branchiarum]
MKQNIFLLSVFFLLINNTLTAQLLAVKTKDSVNEKSKIVARLVGRLKLNGIYDIKRSLSNYSSSLIHDNATSGLDGTAFSMDMRQSQLRFVSTMQLNNGKEIKSMLEADFIGANNTSQFRLRHAWIQYENWMIGQNWSTFGDAALWPGSLLDWDGPVGMVLSRKVQVRYTGRFKQNGNTFLELAAEYPESNSLYDYTLSPVNGVNSTASKTPDVVAAIKYVFGKESFIKLAGLYRSIEFESVDVASGQGKSNFETQRGGGFTAISGVFFRNKSGLLRNIQTQWTIGKGISDCFSAMSGYGLNGFAKSDFSGKLKLLPVHAGYISYQSYWDKKIHSMTILSYNHFYDGVGTVVGWDKMTNYQLTLNTSYDLFDFLTIGIEPQIAFKKLVYGDGNSQGVNTIRINFGMLFNF